MVKSCGASSMWERAGINIPMVILPRRSFSASGRLLIYDVHSEHLLALEVSDIQERRWGTGQSSRV